MSEPIFEMNQEGQKVTFTFRAPSSGALAEAGDHARVAGREVLLSLRSLLDGAISMMDAKDKGDGGQQGSIKVE
jgi:hypothetical protein